MQQQQPVHDPDVCGIDDIRSLAVIFFRGNDPISNLIQAAEEAVEGAATDEIVWTHVGIALTGAMCGRRKDNKLHIFESTWSYGTTPDETTGKGFFGVQLRKLADVVESYDGMIGFANLSLFAANQLMRGRYLKRIQNFVRANLHKGYPWQFPLQLCGALFDPASKVPQPADRKFCSQLVAELLAAVGLGCALPSTCSPHELSRWHVLGPIHIIKK